MVSAYSRRARGFTLIEILVAVTILGTALLAMLGLWYVCFGQTSESADVGSGYSVARQEVEKAKGLGFYYVPEASWADYYARDGRALPSTTDAHYMANTQVQTVKDTNFDGQPEPLASGEPPSSQHLRLVTVEVTDLMESPPKTIFRTKTYLVGDGF